MPHTGVTRPPPVHVDTALGRQRDGTRQSGPLPYRPPPAAQTAGTAQPPPPPPPARPPGHERHGPAPRHAAPTGRAGQGDRVGPPHPHTRAHCTWIVDPNSPPSGRAVRGGGAPDPRRPSQQWKAPPPGLPFGHPNNPKQSRGEPGPDGPPRSTPDGARDRGRTRGGARTTWNSPTSAKCRDRARCARHTTQGGGGRTPWERDAHTHAKGTRGLPERQPDRARGTHRPRGMAYQRARVRDTPTGRPATRSTGHAGREGGNGRDTTPGTGPNPLNRPRAPRTHGRGTAPAKAVVAHCATPKPLG